MNEIFYKHANKSGVMGQDELKKFLKGEQKVSLKFVFSYCRKQIPLMRLKKS
jgi:hypothetical protein